MERPEVTTTAQFGGFTDACYDASAVVVVPVPYDKTSTWIRGADKGPAAVIGASVNLEFYDIETDSEVYKKGIFTDESPDVELPVEQMVRVVEQRVSGHLENGKFVVVLGGEHSVSVGAARAHVRKYPDTTVLQLDAHADLRDEYNGSKYNHACVMARIKEFAPAVQVGIRSMDRAEFDGIEHGRVFFAADIHNRDDWQRQAIEQLSENVYLTVDLDVFDPAFMPSTGTPEPGGLLWYDVLSLLRQLCESRNLVGFDVVELCPNPSNRAPDFAAAKLIHKILSYKFR